MWEVKAGHFVNDGLVVNYAEAYSYIGGNNWNESKCCSTNDASIKQSPDPKIIMALLGISYDSYLEFRELVCKHLKIASSWCTEWGIKI
jgi:hypothetical protein